MTDERLEQAAERAYLAYHGAVGVHTIQPLPWNHLSVAERQQWRNAASATGAVGETVIRFTVPVYLNVTSFDEARHRLGGVPPECCTVIASTNYAGTLREIAALGAKVIEVPPDALASPEAWVMVCPDGRVFSVPS